MYRLTLLLVSVFLCMAGAMAQTNDGHVVRIAPEVHDRQLMLDVDIELQLGSELRDAATKGVPLHFSLELDVRRPRWWWFDQTVISTGQTWRIQFNTLTRQWRIGSGGLSYPAATLDEALDQVRHIRSWAASEIQLEPDTLYHGRLRLRLDTSRLARPFQIDALNSKAWSLTTPWKKFDFSSTAPA